MNAQNRAQEAAYKMQSQQQQKASTAEHDRVRQQFSSMRAEEAAEQKAAAVEMQRSQEQYLQAFGQASAIDNGVTGQSLSAIQDSYLQALGKERSGVSHQLAVNDIQRNYAFDNAGQQFSNNLININQPIAPVDYLGNAVSGLQTGLSTGMSAYRAFG
jgi:hypothetical protein